MTSSRYFAAAIAGCNPAGERLAQKVQGNSEQAQTTAAQGQQSATEAQGVADQASASAAEAKSALSVVDKGGYS